MTEPRIILTPTPTLRLVPKAPPPCACPRCQTRALWRAIVHALGLLLGWVGFCWALLW